MKIRYSKWLWYAAFEDGWDLGMPTGMGKDKRSAFLDLMEQVIDNWENRLYEVGMERELN